jgi:ParB-like chromosome segregation protein Spo0J
VNNGVPVPALDVGCLLEEAYNRQIQAVDGYGLSEYSVTRVPIASLTLTNWLRVKGEDSKHVRVLAELEDKLPPIVVHRATMRVIDGMHRVRAAMLRGAAHVAAILFEGTEDDAFLLAVQLNVAHGLPLSRADRAAAAVRIMRSSPRWSDRAIAGATGLSDKTVASIRRQTSSEIPHLSDRIGLDGRVRPVNAAAGRRLAGEVIAQDPDATITEIAMRAGISLGTARDVRRRLRNGLDPVPSRRRAPAAAGSRPDGEGDGVTGRSLSAQMAPMIMKSLSSDPSLRYNETGRALLRLLALHTMSSADWELLISAVPMHRAQAVAQAARSCSEAWLQFAVRLEHVTQRPATGALTPGCYPAAGAGLIRVATVWQNSPIVIIASFSVSSSPNFTAYSSSTRMASSARASDSRSAPRGPSSVSSPKPSTS